MSPTPAPDSNFISPFPVVSGQPATILATGIDDYDNIKHALDEGASKIRLLNATYHTRYQLERADIGYELEGGGAATILTAGKPDEPMELLDAVDRARWNPTGWPYLLAFYHLASDAPSLVKMKNITLEASDAPGFTGIGFCDIDYLNIGLRALVGHYGYFPVLSRHNEPITLTGTASSSVGATDILNFELWSTVDGFQGIKFVRGVDYTVNEAAGTIARTGGSPIPEGVPVYGHWNDINNRKKVVRTDLQMENVSLNGKHLTRGEQLPHTNVDAAVHFWGGLPYGLEGFIEDVFGNVATVDARVPGYEKFLYSKNASLDESDFLTPSLPTNGIFTLRNSKVEKCSVGMWASGLEGEIAGAGSSYDYQAGTLDQSVMALEDCEMKDVGADAFGWYSYFGDFTAASIANISGNRASNCYGFCKIGGGARYGEFLRFGDWLGADRRVSIGKNDVTVSGQTGSFNFQDSPMVFKTDSIVGPSVEVLTDRIEVTRNKIRWLSEQKKRTVGQPMLFEQHENVLLANNEISSESIQTIEAVNVESGSVEMMGNNFSGWRKLIGTAVDVVLAPASHDCLVVLNPDDLIQNQAPGNNNVIIGGAQA